MTETILNISQVILAVLLMIVILLQAKGAGMGAIGGGGSAASGNFRTKRGMEMRLHQASIVLSIIFFGVALANALI